MARKQVVRLVDDLDGSEALKTVSFGVNGRSYEIELSADNVDIFERSLSRYLSVARTDSTAERERWMSIAASVSPASPVEPRPADDEPQVDPVFDGSTADMRLWAQRKHMVVRPRSRIPREIEHAYTAAARRAHSSAPQSVC